VEGSIRKQGEASCKLSAAQPRFAVPAGGKAGAGAPPKHRGETAASARGSAESGQRGGTCSSELLCSDGV